jgi:hypothetical protein
MLFGFRVFRRPELVAEHLPRLWGSALHRVPESVRRLQLCEVQGVSVGEHGEEEGDQVVHVSHLQQTLLRQVPHASQGVHMLF